MFKLEAVHRNKDCKFMIMYTLQNLKIDLSTVKYLSIIFIVFIFAGCGGANTSVNDEEYNELRKLIYSQKFKVENQWAYPVGGGNINLITNPNSIKITGDSIDVFLPYFGVRQSGGTYGGNDGGIKYRGPLKNLEIEENIKKGNIKVSFETKQNSEDLDFNMTLYPNKKVRTFVNSNKRTTISYEGELSTIKSKD